jgi:hypothetical protein
MSRDERRKLSSVSANIAVAIFRVNLKMATATFTETLESLQHSMQLITES